MVMGRAGACSGPRQGCLAGGVGRTAGCGAVAGGGVPGSGWGGGAVGGGEAAPHHDVDGDLRDDGFPPGRTQLSHGPVNVCEEINYESSKDRINWKSTAVCQQYFVKLAKTLHLILSKVILVLPRTSGSKAKI